MFYGLHDKNNHKFPVAQTINPISLSTNYIFKLVLKINWCKSRGWNKNPHDLGTINSSLISVFGKNADGLIWFLKEKLKFNFVTTLNLVR